MMNLINITQVMKLLLNLELFIFLQACRYDGQGCRNVSFSQIVDVLHLHFQSQILNISSYCKTVVAMQIHFDIYQQKNV